MRGGIVEISPADQKQKTTRTESPQSKTTKRRIHDDWYLPLGDNGVGVPLYDGLNNSIAWCLILLQEEVGCARKVKKLKELLSVKERRSFLNAFCGSLAFSKWLHSRTRLAAAFPGDGMKARHLRSQPGSFLELVLAWVLGISPSWRWHRLASYLPKERSFELLMSERTLFTA